VAVRVVGQVPGPVMTYTSGWVPIDVVNGIKAIRLTDPALQLDEDGYPAGLTYVVENLTGEALRAHGIIVDMYFRGSPWPFRVVSTADGWFNRGGLGSQTSWRYSTSLVTPRSRAPLEKIRIAPDYVETARGSQFGEDISGFANRFREEREAQRKITDAVANLVAQGLGEDRLQEAIGALSSTVRTGAARYALAYYSQTAKERGSAQLREELARRSNR